MGRWRSSLEDTRRVCTSPPSASPLNPPPTCLFYQAWSHTRAPYVHNAHVHMALYGRPPLHYVNTIRSLQLDLDYLESTCNVHIRSAAEDVFHVTMAGTCRLKLRRDTLEKIKILKKQRPAVSTFYILILRLN
ncbi:unnamed protein product, partial [Iphiclides podalirius]